MTDKRAPEQDDKEVEARFNETLGRLVNTPHKPHAARRAKVPTDEELSVLRAMRRDQYELIVGHPSLPGLERAGWVLLGPHGRLLSDEARELLKRLDG